LKEGAALVEHFCAVAQNFEINHWLERHIRRYEYRRALFVLLQ
jgi:hypothetical protein